MANIIPIPIQPGRKRTLYRSTTILVANDDFKIPFAGSFPDATLAEDDFVSIAEYDEIHISVTSSHASDPSGVTWVESPDGSDIEAVYSASLIAGTPVSQRITPSHRWGRFKFENAGTNQGDFDCTVWGVKN